MRTSERGREQDRQPDDYGLRGPLFETEQTRDLPPLPPKVDDKGSLPKIRGKKVRPPYVEGQTDRDLYLEENK